MNIDYEAKISELYTTNEIPGWDDVVKKVVWEIEFFDLDFRRSVNVTALVITQLNTEDLVDTFVAYSELTQQQILQYCLDQEGGSGFLEYLQSVHASALAQQYSDRHLTLRPINEVQVS